LLSFRKVPSLGLEDYSLERSLLYIYIIFLYKHRFNLFSTVTSGRSCFKQYLTSRGAIAIVINARSLFFECIREQRALKKTITVKKKVVYFKLDRMPPFPHIRRFYFIIIFIFFIFFLSTGHSCVVHVCTYRYKYDMYLKFVYIYTYL